MFAHSKRALYISSVLKEDVEDKMLECQTEKDRNQKLNHHTAGIISCILAAIDCNNIHGGDIYVGLLAGIWPCGMITMLSELYIAESKTQVYAALHDYLSRNSSIFSELSEFIALVHTA